MAKHKIRRCSKNTPLLVGLGVFAAVEVVNIAFNPTVPIFTTLYLTAPVAMVLGAGALTVTVFTCHR